MKVCTISAGETDAVGSWTSGTRNATGPAHPGRSPTAASGKCGGAAKKAIPGRPRSTAGAAGRAAPTARAGGWDRATTWPPCIRRWPLNGTCGKTHRGSRPTFWRGATAPRGGSAKGAIPGRLASIPGCPAAAVRSARGGWWCRGKIPWPMPRRSWRLNGTRSGTPP